MSQNAFEQCIAAQGAHFEKFAEIPSVPFFRTVSSIANKRQASDCSYVAGVVYADYVLAASFMWVAFMQ